MLFLNRSERETSPFFMRSQRTNELLLRKRVSAFDSRRRIIEQANDNASGSEPCEIPTDGIKRQSAFNEQSAGIRMLSACTARMTWRTERNPYQGDVGAQGCKPEHLWCTPEKQGATLIMSIYWIATPCGLAMTG